MRWQVLAQATVWKLWPLLAPPDSFCAVTRTPLATLAIEFFSAKPKSLPCLQGKVCIAMDEAQPRTVDMQAKATSSYQHLISVSIFCERFIKGFLFHIISGGWVDGSFLFNLAGCFCTHCTSYTFAMASNLIAMASNLETMASNLHYCTLYTLVHQI